MWREYTRESPARKGLALAASAAALAGTVAMAYALTNLRTSPLEATRRIHPPYWPISFELPESWVRRSLDVNFLEPETPDDLIGRIAFEDRRRGNEVVARATILFTLLEPGDTVEDFLDSLPDDATTASGAVQIGNWTGSSIRFDDPEAQGLRAAAAVSPEGLAIAVICEHAHATSAADRLVERIAGSVRPEPWFLPRF
ncbi:hypothetical protein RAS2_25510 [Phycisphaerae bacterium RAS2]|nr:hypothetical protein RAS2_25510 [Phycisphaerae bacterium RAS2]